MLANGGGEWYNVRAKVFGKHFDKTTEVQFNETFDDKVTCARGDYRRALRQPDRRVRRVGLRSVTNPPVGSVDRVARVFPRSVGRVIYRVSARESLFGLRVTRYFYWQFGYACGGNRHASDLQKDGKHLFGGSSARFAERLRDSARLCHDGHAVGGILDLRRLYAVDGSSICLHHGRWRILRFKAVEGKGNFLFNVTEKFFIR